MSPARNDTAAQRGRDAPAGRSECVEAELKRLARRLGFAACGITTADDLACGPLLGDWLDAGRHGDMDYLAVRHERRLRPSSVLPDARAAVVVAWPYAATLPPDPDWRAGLRGRVAAYALGADYHGHVARRLERLSAWLAGETGAASAVHVDGGPLVEKELARRAGIGWYGRNTNLLRPGLGSTFLLGVVVTSAPLSPDPPFAADHCGSCRACAPACPTGALSAGPTIDARLCISYLTIEHRGPVPPALRERMGNWIFGCDVCQDVCPWNEAVAVPHPLQSPWLPGLLAMDAATFRDAFDATPLLRPKRRGLARNAAVALGNSGNPSALPFLERALREHDEPLVRAHAAWAFARIAGHDRAVLERALERESVPPVRRELAAALVNDATPHAPPNAAGGAGAA